MPKGLFPLEPLTREKSISKYKTSEVVIHRSSGNHNLLKEKKKMKPGIGSSSNPVVKFKYHI